MMKQAQSLCSKKDDVWARIMKAKYKCGQDEVPIINKQRPSSNLWKRMCKSQDDLKSSLTWNIRDGRQVKFWNLSQFPFGEDPQGRTQCNVLDDIVYKKFCDYVMQDAHWDIQHMSQYLTSFVIDIFLSIPPTNNARGVDTLCLNHTSDDNFRMASNYNNLQHSEALQNNQIFYVIWTWKGPKMFRILMQKIVVNGLLMNEERMGMHIATNASCQLYCAVWKMLIMCFIIVQWLKQFGIVLVNKSLLGFARPSPEAFKCQNVICPAFQVQYELYSNVVFGLGHLTSQLMGLKSIDPIRTGRIHSPSTSSA